MPRPTRRHYLITYDVADDKRRTRIFQTLRDHGDHAQYSVFLCELNDRELAQLRGRLIDLTHAREDQVMILDLGPAGVPIESCLETIGRGFEPPQRVLVV